MIFNGLKVTSLFVDENIFNLNRIIFLLIFAAGLWSGQSLAQVEPKESLLVAERDSLVGDQLQSDSLDTPVDTVFQGTIQLSESSFDAPVVYTARDSMYFDVLRKQLHLYGDAALNYTSISLKADHIVYHWESGLMEAFHKVDSTGRKEGIPEFKDGDQSFIADRMKYNFKTNKGLVYDVISKEGDMFIRGSKTKFSREKKDTIVEDIIYSSNAVFTTCNHETPHFGIRSGRQKIVPNKEVIIGPSVLEIQGVPTPLFLPFGFFPITTKRTAGLIIPTDYTYNDNWGYGIEDVGFYYPFNEYIDATIFSKLYFNGTWGSRLDVNYNKRYKYTGGLNIEYNRIKNEISGTTNTLIENSYSFNWSHNQSPQAHPTFSIGGNLSLSGNRNNQLNNFDFRSQTENTISSNLRFTKKFPYSPFSLNVNLSNTQNVNTRQLDLTFPSVRLQMNKIFPFEKKERVGSPKWYEDIYLDYNLSASNSVRTTDTTLFEPETLDKLEYGVQHTASTGKSVRLFKYFSLNPSVSYREIWNFQGLEKQVSEMDTLIRDTIFDEITKEILSISETRDTITEITDNRIQDFNAFRDLDFGVSLNTKIFGTWLMDKGWLRGLRHTFSPNFSFSYKPALGNFEDTYIKQYTTPLSKDTVEYNITDQFAYQRVNAREQMTLSYGISDIFEGKRFVKQDSVVEKFNIIKRMSFGGTYDFLADSLNFSDPSFNLSTPIFNMITLQFGWSWSLYEQDENGRNINQFYRDTEGKLLRSLGGSLRLNTNFSIPQLQKLFKGRSAAAEDDEAGKRTNELWDLITSLRFRHGFRFNFDQRSDKVVGSVQNHTFNVNGNIPLTDNWNINVGNVGWDFLSERITYPDIGFSRDLHCWEMNLNWQPSVGAYRFTIKVKPGTLEFLELPYNRNPYETF